MDAAKINAEVAGIEGADRQMNADRAAFDLEAFYRHQEEAAAWVKKFLALTVAERQEVVSRLVEDGYSDAADAFGNHATDLIGAEDN